MTHNPGLNCRIVLEDWRKVGSSESIYNTELGERLSSGELHSGASFPADLKISPELAAEIQEAYHKHSAYPVFRVFPDFKCDGGKAHIWVDISNGPLQMGEWRMCSNCMRFRDPHGNVVNCPSPDANKAGK